MVTRQPLRVTQPTALDQVARLPASGSVVLEFPSLPSDEAKTWQREINALLHTCGCGEATAALLIALGALSIVACASWNTVTASPLLASVIGLGCSALSIAVGKVFGQRRGRRRLTDSIGRLQAVLTRRALDQDSIRQAAQSNS